MKILLINNHHKPDGGTERYYFDLAELLKSHGHTIAFFSMNDPKNENTKWNKYFVKNINFEKRGFGSMINKFSRMLYSLESKKNIAKLISEFTPDIVHINNIYFYISPSILGEIKKAGIPIIQTVHDYQLISPNVILFFNGKICEVTKPNNYYKAFLNRNIKGSYVASLMAVAASYTQHLFRFYEKYVDFFIFPSKFIKNKFSEYKFAYKNHITMPNFVTSHAISKSNLNNDYVLYFGRINDHKGVSLLIKLASKNPMLKIKLVGRYGDKKIENNLKKYIKTGHKNLEVVDHQTSSNLTKIIDDCRFAVVPSLWYENQPYTILEAFAHGKCVVASKIGGIPEIVDHGKTGLLFNPNSYEEFEKSVLKLWKNNRLANKLGNNGYKYVTKKLNPNIYYKKILAIYKKVIKDNIKRL